MRHFCSWHKRQSNLIDLFNSFFHIKSRGEKGEKVILANWITLFMRNNEYRWIRPITLIPFLTCSLDLPTILLTPKQNATIAISRGKNGWFPGKGDRLNVVGHR